MVEYYSAIIRNGVVIAATTWMTLENIMLSERVSHKGPCMARFHFNEIFRIERSIEMGSGLVLV